MEPMPRPLQGNPWGPEATPYLAMGGEAAVRTLVEAFYDRIDAESPVLRAMLPRNDSGSRRKLFEYLSGWLGGPNLYIDKRGHPQLRRRHLQFTIGEAEANEWMRCMRLSIAESGVNQAVAGFLEDRLSPLAEHMVNS